MHSFETYIDAAAQAGLSQHDAAPHIFITHSQIKSYFYRFGYVGNKNPNREPLYPQKTLEDRVGYRCVSHH